jgi:hypothetical protein
MIQRIPSSWLCALSSCDVGPNCYLIYYDSRAAGNRGGRASFPS